MAAAVEHSGEDFDRGEILCLEIGSDAYGAVLAEPFVFPARVLGVVCRREFLPVLGSADFPGIRVVSRVGEAYDPARNNAHAFLCLLRLPEPEAPLDVFACVVEADEEALGITSRGDCEVKVRAFGRERDSRFRYGHGDFAYPALRRRAERSVLEDEISRNGLSTEAAYFQGLDYRTLGVVQTYADGSAQVLKACAPAVLRFSVK